MEGSLHDQGGPSYKVFMPQRMWRDEPWKLEEFNNVQNKVTTSSYKVQTRELCLEAERKNEIVKDVREVVRKWITLGGEGHGKFTLCDIRKH